MSRIRTAIRILPARSICVPPTSTVLPCPILSSIAAASHGVATSRLIGPAPSRHHSPPKQPAKITANTRDHDRQALDPAFAGDPSVQRREIVAQPVKARNWNATTAAVRGGPPPRHGRIPAGSSSHCEIWASARGFDPWRGPEPWSPWGELFLSHCLSVLALRLIAAAGAPIDLYRALLCRHRCQSSINTVTRRRAQGTR